MNEEHTKQLIEEFPILFGKPLERYAFSFYKFECSDGWFDLIRETSRKVVALDPLMRIAQVKEKFGGLRYYIDAPHQNADEIRIIVQEAENLSFGICEGCGKSVPKEMERSEKMPHEPSWLYTVCSEECKERIRNG